MAFHVGQKVVCVDAIPRAWGFGPLKKGSVYTVAAYLPRATGLVGPGEFATRDAVQVAEIEMSRLDWFRASRFRPVVEKKTDISIFTEMLKPRELVRLSD